MGLVVRKNIKCSRKGRMCLSAAFIWFLEKDFYFIKVIKIGFLWISLLTKIKPHIHVFKIYMWYELFNYVLKVYVAYVNSTVISKITMLVVYFSFSKYIFLKLRTIYNSFKAIEIHFISIWQCGQIFVTAYIITQQRCTMWPLRITFFLPLWFH